MGPPKSVTIDTSLMSHQLKVLHKHIATLDLPRRCCGPAMMRRGTDGPAEVGDHRHEPDVASAQGAAQAHRHARLAKAMLRAGDDEARH